ncbi:MAG TPA: hypothetical protein VFT65_10500 [Candidatus Angelobacter sp.]|nr:hypothetical protein [Candidatus Angelobacter sp.]
MDLFSSSDSAKHFVYLVLEDECHRQGRTLSEFEQKLFGINSEGWLEERERLAEKYGVSDNGWAAAEQLTNYLRAARAGNDPCTFHSSGKTTSELLSAAQVMLDRSTDFAWLIVRDSAHRPFGKTQKALASIIAIFAIAGFIGLIFLKVFRIGGTVLLTLLAALLAGAFLIDLFRKKSMSNREL